MKAKLIKEASGYDLYRVDKDGKRVTFASTQDYKQKLSLKNCQAIERGYDLDELFDEVDESIDYHEFDFTSFRLGFQKALEILGDKKFSEEDVISMIEKSRETGLTAEYLILTKQQTEWDVELEMELEVDTSKLFGAIYGQKPKLDADNCLILKLKSE